MFSFFKKKKPEAETPAAVEPAVPASSEADAQPEAPAEQPGFLRRLFGGGEDAPALGAAEGHVVLHQQHRSQAQHHQQDDDGLQREELPREGEASSSHGEKSHACRRSMLAGC